MNVRRRHAVILVAALAISLFTAAGAWAQPTELFISEYIEGSSNNKAIEIYNGTTAAVDLAAGNYLIQMYFNGSLTAGTTITLSGTVAAGDVWVVADDSAVAAILAETDQQSTSSFFNGDDAIVLRKGGAAGTIVDVIGQIGTDPGTQWGTGFTSTGDNTLRRKASVCQGDTDGSNAFDPATEWDGFATDTFDGLGFHGSLCELFISEYIEGSSNNKAIEIYNGTAAAVDLAAGTYVLQQYFNGSGTAGLTISLTGTVAAGDVYVVAQASANATILAQADQTNGSGWFNGDDAVVLRKGGAAGAIVDSFGQVGLDPGTEWGTGVVSTADNTLRRKTVVCKGDTDASNAFDPSLEWDGFATDTFDGLGSHGAVCGVITATTLSINDVTLAEGDAGTTIFTFTVTVSAPAPAGGVTFDIATADGTAMTADNDYVANSLTGQTIAAGNTTFTFDVTVNGDATIEANETFFVNVTNVVATGVTLLDGQGIGTISNDDVILVPIHDIQGPGNSSPIVGSSVTTSGIVTGLKGNGFFIQEPDATVDADPATSEGIFVFTSSAPPAAAAIGNLVQVTGTISEFSPSQDPLQPPLTELTSPTVLQLSTGNPLPAAIPLTATFPDPAGPFDQLERVEGMRVSVASLTVVAPTAGNVSEANATATSRGDFFGVVTGVARPFREPGIQAPDPAPVGSIPPIPRWDTNPETIGVDSNGQTGTGVIDAGTGAVLTGLVGPLDYGFRRYTILPDLSAMIGVAGGPTATSVAAATESEFTTASFNMQRFFDTVNDPGIGEPVLTAGAFDTRLNKASIAIRNHLQMPDIIGVAEMENLTTLQSVAARISSDAIAAMQPDPLYQAYLVEGNDVGGIDVGFLVKTAIVSGATPRVEVVSVVQESAGTLFVNPDTSTELLNDRPPLVLEAIIHHPNGASFPVTVIANHLRSLNGADDLDAGSSGWATVGDRVRAKRQAQAEDLANIIQTRQTNDPVENIIVLGDFNAFDVNDGYGHSMGVIGGTPVPDNETAVPGDGVDLVNPDLSNLVGSLPAAERYSYTFDGQAQSLDHVLINGALTSATLARREEHARVNADFPETARNNAANGIRLSDHDPIVSFYQVAAFAIADMSITKVDTPDPVTAGETLTYTITLNNAGPSNAASVSLSDTLAAGTTFVSLSSPGGWSCTTPAVGSGGTVSCSNATMATGSAVFTLTVAVDGSVTAGTLITNTATVSSSTSDPNPGNESSTATSTVATIGISIDDVSVTEGNAGSTAATFTISLARAAAQTITVNWASAGNDATSGVDFTAAAGLVTFVPGDTAETLTVQVTGDLIDEANETYFVNLSTVTGPGAILDGQGVGTIIDDEGMPTVSIGDQRVPEGAGGATTRMTFNVSLSNPSAAIVTVNAATAAGTATTGSDFRSTSQTVTFAPGVVTQPFTVLVNDDSLIESEETLFVNLSLASGTTIGDGQGIGTIVDNDEALPAPDPVILSNCLPVVGGPCVLTAGSSSGTSQAGWTYIWYVDGVASGTGSTFSPQFAAPGTYVILLAVTGSDGQQGSATTTLTIETPCPAGNLCMQGGRFEVSLVATDPRTGNSGAGVPIQENGQFGFFALPVFTGSTENPEVFVKILDGRPVNGNFWVFYGGLTDLEYTITVVDTDTGGVKTYMKPGGSSAGGFDVGGGVKPEECAGEVDGTAGTPVSPESCAPGSDRLCLLGGRFRVQLSARDHRTGNTAEGLSIPENDVFGYFALPGLTGDASNPEVFVKVLDGTGVNGHHWIFYAGLTDLEYTMTVTDVTTGVVKSYTKAAASACGGFDTNGF